jgi:pimeloyl-ACP methyl ester carboxylesterase
MFRQNIMRWLALVLSLGVCITSGLASLGQMTAVAQVTDDESTAMGQERIRLEKRLATITAHKPLQADARIFLRSIEWALRYETKLAAKDLALIKQALKRASQRVDALAAGKPAWPTRRGKMVRGFVSAVDESVQPYGLIVPANYDPKRAMRLDVVLHGSSRPTGLSELRFMSRFDEGDDPAKAVPEQDYLELHPLGRVENGYRWAGETDVFEAIDAVAEHYNVDRDRIVLRGMSMGASGTWHLGLKHPDRFVALGPYCGYVDTHEFSKTPLPNFIKVGPLPANQEATLHMLDSVDYAANAGIVPAIACMGEKDVFFHAHVLMGRAMEKEGLKMVNLISPETGHAIDPVTFKEQMRRIHEIADKGMDRNPQRLRFVTWTLKYGHCHWLQILGLDQHYRRAEFEARVAEDGTVDVKVAKSITRFAILPPAWRDAKPRLWIEGKDIVLPASEGKALKAVIGRRDEQWVYLGKLDELSLTGKRPGVQGPIDDAFTTPFLCVRGTGEAWSPKVQAWSQASLKRFTHEWQRYFRGEMRVKDDKDVTDDDVRTCNLILFGDPGSNRWINKVLPKMPIQWTRAELRLGDERYAAADHVPLLIQPNPFAANRYVVFNSSHTFREKELASLNYLLFPRLGDWAVLRVAGQANAAEPLGEELVKTGFCDEQWRLAR